jgi:hypothetical protein
MLQPIDRSLAAASSGGCGCLYFAALSNIRRRHAKGLLSKAVLAERYRQLGRTGWGFKAGYCPRCKQQQQQQQQQQQAFVAIEWPMPGAAGGCADQQPHLTTSGSPHFVQSQPHEHNWTECAHMQHCQYVSCTGARGHTYPVCKRSLQELNCP